MRKTERKSNKRSFSAIPEYLKCKHKDEVCIVMGNGSSLLDYDLTDPFFTQNVTIGVNNIGKVFTPTYYVITDAVAAQRYAPSIKKSSKKSLFLVGNHIPKKTWSSAYKDTRYKVIYYRLADTVGSPNYEKIYHCGTVGMVALNIAWMMGFKYIFLLGIDGYRVQGPSHFDGRQVFNNLHHDNKVLKFLRTVMASCERDGRYLFTLSYRSVYREFVPVWWSKEELFS